MGKGKQAKIGTETTNQNGYVSVKTSTGWKLKHHVIAEERLGRPLENERCFFIDGDRTNLDPENIGVAKKQVRSVKRMTVVGTASRSCASSSSKMLLTDIRH